MGRALQCQVSVRGGRALRHGLATADPQIILPARRAIHAGLATVRADGAFPASLPSEIAGDRQPGLSNQASAAAFFLSDACPALLLAGPTADALSRIQAATEWLERHRMLLRERDQSAPNRLLISALAFVACGQLLDDVDTVASANPFIDDALGFVRGDGVFLEAGGGDTSYQAVNLVVAIEIGTLIDGSSEGEPLHDAVQSGALWLADRIGAHGALDSSNNTRTCAGEDFIGRPKEVDLREVFRALAYAEALNIPISEQLALFKSWLMTRPDPCAGIGQIE